MTAAGRVHRGCGSDRGNRARWALVDPKPSIVPGTAAASRSPRRGTREPLAQGVQAGPDPVADPDLGVGAFDVVPYGLLAQHQGFGDLSVALSAGDQGEDLSLAVGEPGRERGRRLPGALPP